MGRASVEHGESAPKQVSACEEWGGRRREKEKGRERGGERWGKRERWGMGAAGGPMGIRYSTVTRGSRGAGHGDGGAGGRGMAMGGQACKRVSMRVCSSLERSVRISICLRRSATSIWLSRSAAGTTG